MKINRSKLYLVIVLGIVLFYIASLVRFSHTVHPFPVMVSDSTEYAQLAQNILTNHVFSLSQHAPFNPETFRTPGYPLFIAVILILFRAYFAVSIVQIVLTFCTAFLIYRMMQRFVSETWAFFAAVLYLVEPMVMAYSLIVLSDIPFVFLLVSIVYVFFFSARNTKNFFFAGLICGFSILVRPLAVLFPLVIVGWEVLCMNRKEVRKVAILLGAFICGVMLVVSPWLIRNKIETNAWGISSLGPSNLLYSNLIPYLAARDHLSEAAVEQKIYQENGSLGDPRSLANSSKITNVSLRYLKQDPFGYARYHIVETAPLFLASSLKEFVKLWSGTVGEYTANPNLSRLLFQGKFSGVWEALKQQGIYTFEKFVWLGIVIVGLFSLADRKHRRMVVFFCVVILYFALATGPVSNTRYRLPLEPFLFMLAVMGASNLYAIKRT